MSKIEKELSEATGITHRSNKTSRSSFLIKVAEAVRDFDDDKWEELSEEAQDWVNDAIESLNSDENPDDFPDADEAAEEEEPEEEEEDTEEEEEDTEEEEEDTEEEEEDMDDSEDTDDNTKPKKKKKVAGKKKAVKAKAKTAKKAKSSPRPAGAQRTIKEMVIEDPEISIDDLAAQVEKKGFTVSRVTISTIRTSVRDTMRILDELGYMKKR